MLLTDGRIRIENLKPNTNYTLSVQAKNDVGVGQPIQLTVATETISALFYIIYLGAHITLTHCVIDWSVSCIFQFSFLLC